ncbi:MAG: hypothetical protein IJ565_06085 [Bacilli bacterium]|nr:hypothetical protein [Bacilli bacterium]
MIRTYNLQNAIYKTKYRDIYKLIFTADIDEINDHSNWFYKERNNYVESNQPLWIIMESKIINKRIWITHSWGQLEITTAQLDLNVDSTAYHDSYERYTFKNQKELCDKLKQLLEPCLKKDKEQEMDEIEYDR